MSLFWKLTEDGTYSFTSAGNALIVVLIILSLLIVSFFTNKDNQAKISTKQLVFSAMCMALAFVTSNIKVVHMPMGGSVTLFSMFFICFIGYLYGPRVGITSAVAYGLLQLIVDPYVISIPQMLCDYILAFGALGLSGFFYKKKNGMILGYLVGIFGRYVFSVLSGVIFFGAYAADWGMAPLAYSSLYNIIYIGAEGAVTVVILLVPLMRQALGRIKIMANEASLKGDVVTD